MSLRRRLIGGIVLVLTAMWALTAVWFFFDVRAELREVLDARMASSARMVQGLIERGELRLPNSSPIPDRPAPRPKIPGLPTELACQIWTLEGRLINAGSGGPMLGDGSIPDGISNWVVDSERWRVYALTDAANGIRVLTAERRDLRRSLIIDMALKLSAPIALVLPTTVLLVWVAVRRGLVPLDQLRRSIQRRNVDALDPIPDQGVPQELTPMVGALNSLFVRLAEAFERERRFTGDAAHELRTPLAGIKTQLQIAQAADAEVRDRALAQAEAGVDRMSRLVTQMLMLARLEGHRAESVEHGECRVAEVIDAVLQEFKPAAAERDVRLLQRANIGTITAPLPASMLHTALRNLVENAIRHSPEAGTVTVDALLEPTQLQLRVLDEGRGLAPEELSRATRRFYRSTDTSTSGTGLGLSIVDAIAHRYGLQLSLENRLEVSGLAARLEIPVRTPRLTPAGEPTA